ncbi:hypothetical protein NJ76_26665 [Rhodococcus sp. IITR03]|nr:hypothetical protein NJ76_26665 [Rhodococcus sp. IITR03]
MIAVHAPTTTRTVTTSPSRSRSGGRVADRGPRTDSASPRSRTCRIDTDTTAPTASITSCHHPAGLRKPSRPRTLRAANSTRISARTVGSIRNASAHTVTHSSTGSRNNRSGANRTGRASTRSDSRVVHPTRDARSSRPTPSRIVRT